MSLLAPREIYAREERQAQRAIDVWAGRVTVAESTWGVSAELLANFVGEQAVHPLLQRRIVDPTASLARFNAATHLFACNCSESISKIPAPARLPVLNEMHTALAAAIGTLRGPQELFHGAKDMLVGVAVSDTGAECAVVDRRGLRIISTVGGNPYT